MGELRKLGRPSKSKKTVVRIESEIVDRAKIVAKSRGQTVPDYLSDMLRKIIDKDWAILS